LPDREGINLETRMLANSNPLRRALLKAQPSLDELRRRATWQGLWQRAQEEEQREVECGVWSKEKSRSGRLFKIQIATSYDASGRAR
jgi:hypothetical protein